MTTATAKATAATERKQEEGSQRLCLQFLPLFTAKLPLSQITEKSLVIQTDQSSSHTTSKAVAFANMIVLVWQGYPCLQKKHPTIAETAAVNDNMQQVTKEDLLLQTPVLPDTGD